MIKAMVVDDEVLSAEHLCRRLERLGVEDTYYSGDPVDALDRISLLEPDVLFLDIEMPEISGLELAERVLGMGYSGEIVFITAYNQYAIEAFSVNALDYLLKPVLTARLQQTVERVKKRRQQEAAAERGDARKIKVYMFGSLSLYIGDKEEPVRWTTAKCAELFAFMLLQPRGREVSKGKLIGALWPDKNKEKADINMRSTICRLNKTLREHGAALSMLSTGNGYKLDCGDTVIAADAFSLERLAVSGTEIGPQNEAYFSSIVAGYSDMLLEEFNSEWCDAPRVSYHRYFISAAKKLIKYYEVTDAEPLKLLNAIQQLIKYEPYDEEVRASALKLHYRLEGRPGIEKYYREYKELLRGELGIEPGKELQRLYRYFIKL